MKRILDYEPPIKLMPAVEKFFHDVAPLEAEPLRSKFATFASRLRIRLSKIARQ